MKTIHIEVDNLKCGGCENTIRTQLKKDKQVLEVKAHFDSSAIEINYEGEIDENKLCKILSNLGYPAKGTSSTIQNVKSYLSCAIGKIHN